MIRKQTRPGLVVYEKDENEIRLEALLALAELDVDEPDEKKRTARKKAVLEELKKPKKSHLPKL